LDGSCRAIRAGVGDRDDGERDDGIEDVRHDRDTSEVAGQDEWRVLGIVDGGVGEIWIVARDDKAQDEEGHNIEEGDTPEDLLSGLGDGLSWVISFRGCESDQFGSSEGECSGDEHGAKALEAVLESLVW
jgi:hypothetical protein